LAVFLGCSNSKMNPVLIVGTLQKRVLVKFLHLMSDGAKQKIDCRRSYMAFYIIAHGL